jgi:agmatine/peptidylarginine deiminase
MWSYLPPLVGAPTSHVDLFLTIAGPSSVVLASYDPADDPENSLLMNDHAGQLAAISVDGQPMKVFRVEQPPAKDGIWRSYTNVIYANGVVLVPQYPDVSPELDRRALATFAQALPDWKVVGVDASTIIGKRGSLHCLSLNLPSMPCLVDR